MHKKGEALQRVIQEDYQSNSKEYDQTLQTRKENELVIFIE